MAGCTHYSLEKSMEIAQNICAQKGVRFTEPRQHILEIILQSKKALTASEIMLALGNNQPPITYRALDFLKKMGLIHQITSLNAYIACLHPTETNHIAQMLVCTDCRKVIEIISPFNVEQLIEKAKENAFFPKQTSIEMLGICQDCAKL